MSILHFTGAELLNEQESDSDSDCEDEVTYKQEHQRRQLSVLLKHDEVAYNSWLEVSHHYRILSQICSLHEQNISILTEQNEVLTTHNASLCEENEKIRTELDGSFQLTQELLSILSHIQEQLVNDSSKQSLVYNIQDILTKVAIKKYGYV